MIAASNIGDAITTRRLAKCGVAFFFSSIAIGEISLNQNAKSER